MLRTLYSAMDEDAPAPHEEEGMDPLLKELVKSKSPENTTKSQEQLEEEANILLAGLLDQPNSFDRLIGR